MSSDFVITEEMKQAEARRLEMRLAAFRASNPIAQELRPGKLLFENDDTEARLGAFDRSEAAEAALEAALEVAECEC